MLPPVPSADTSRSGPAWEGPGPVFSRFLDTTRGVLLETTSFFRTMRTEGGLEPPLTFGILGTLAGGLVGALYQLMLSASMGGMFDPSEIGDHMFVSLFSSGCIVVIVPIVAVLSIFIGSAIYHVMLMRLGEARWPFETTIRVVAYAACDELDRYTSRHAIGRLAVHLLVAHSRRSSRPFIARCHPRPS